MGVTPKNGIAVIKDRYVQVAFDLAVKEADEACLYEDFDSAATIKKKHVNSMDEFQKMMMKKYPKLNPENKK